MGGAVWVFLWLWGQSDPTDGLFSREVRSGSPVRVEEVCAALGLSDRTIKRHLAHLRDAGYLTTFREHHAFTAVVSLWRPEPQTEESGAKSGTSLSMSGAKNGTSLAQKSAPPGPPGKEEDLFLDIPTYKGSSLNSRGFLLRTNSNKRASVVPLRPGVEGQSPSSAPAAAVVAAGPTPGRLRMEQAIQHHLSRIDEWERPEFNRTLAEALCSLKVQELNEVFEIAWRLHRTRNKALELRAFIQAFYAAKIRVTDHNERAWVGNFMNNPFEFDTPSRAAPAIAPMPRGETQEITIEFEGVEQ